MLAASDVEINAVPRNRERSFNEMIIKSCMKGKDFGTHGQFFYPKILQYICSKNCFGTISQ